MDSAMKESHRSISSLCSPPTQQGVVGSHKEEGIGGGEGMVPKGKEQRKKGKCHVILLSCSQKVQNGSQPMAAVHWRTLGGDCSWVYMCAFCYAPYMPVSDCAQ